MIGVYLLKNTDKAFSARDIYPFPPRIVANVISVLYTRKHGDGVSLCGVEDGQPSRFMRRHK